MREAFGYTFPNYDPVALATGVCRDRLWALTKVRFYRTTVNQRFAASWSKA